MNSFEVIDTFSGTAGAPVESRPPTQQQVGAYWYPQIPGTLLMQAGPQARNNHTLNAYSLYSDLMVDNAATITGQDASVQLDISGATAFGDAYGGLSLSFNGGYQAYVQVNRDSGIPLFYVKAGAFNESSEPMPPPSAQPWNIQITGLNDTVTITVNGVVMKTASFPTTLESYMGQIGFLNMNALGVVWRNFRVAGTYEAPPPPGSAFWQDFLATRETF